MGSSQKEAVIIGAGAAGIAAARKLHDAKVDCLLVEARRRLGGRAWTILDRPGAPIDLGCGWLHSADRNPWREIAETQGRRIDRTPPPWMRPSPPIGFPISKQYAFRDASQKFYRRLHSFAQAEPDRPAAGFLDPLGPWNNLLDAVSTYYSGAKLERISAHDLNRYEDTGTNWRIAEGYGTVIVAHAAGLPVALGCPVRRIDHSGRQLKVETADGTLTADAALVTLPSSLIADETLAFAPALPGKTEAARALPLGLAAKLFLSLSDAEEFEPESRLFGRIDRSDTGVYHMRPFGRPQIEAYFGGDLAAELESGGADAFLDFAKADLTGLLGNDFANRVGVLGLHLWGADPFSRGSYSYALPGKADCRAVLAAPIEGRIFFAGEACSRSSYSTAHGAYRSGMEAADQVIRFLTGRRRAAGTST